MMRRMNHKTAALIGGLFMAPFVAANAMVGHRIEPFFSFIRPGPHGALRKLVGESLP